jgi:CO/xanthine dehydrogenase FAD-binding subunit
MDRFEYVNATSVAEALAQLGDGREAKAGGVDLLDRMKEGLSSPKRIVNLRTIPGLDGVDIEPAGLRIGAGHPRGAGGAQAAARALSRHQRRRPHRGDAADPQHGHGRRQPAAAAALLVLPQS